MKFFLSAQIVTDVQLNSLKICAETLCGRGEDGRGKPQATLYGDESLFKSSVPKGAGLLASFTLIVHSALRGERSSMLHFRQRPRKHNGSSCGAVRASQVTLFDVEQSSHSFRRISVKDHHQKKKPRHECRGFYLKLHRGSAYGSSNQPPA